MSVVGALVAGATGNYRIARCLGAVVAGSIAGTIATPSPRPAAIAAPFPTAPGAGIMLWGTLSTRVRELADGIIRAQPQVIAVLGSSGMPADFRSSFERAIPGLRWWACEWVYGAQDADAAVGRMSRLVDRLGAEAALWDVEHEFLDSGAAGRTGAQRLLAGWKAASRLPQGITSYARARGSFPWAGFSGGRDEYGTFEQSCDFVLPQYYPFGDEQRSPSPAGALRGSVAQGWPTWEKAMRDGLVRNGMRFGAMIPSAHVAEQEAFEVYSSWPVCLGFPWHGDIDQAGYEALARGAARWRAS